MERFLTIIYKILNIIIWIIGIYFIAQKNYIIALILVMLYVYLYLTYKNYRASYIKKNYVDKDIFNSLYIRYLTYKNYENKFPFDIKNKIDNFKNSQDIADENFDEILKSTYYYTNFKK